MQIYSYGDYILSFSVSDAAGNTASVVERLVRIVDAALDLTAGSNTGQLICEGASMAQIVYRLVGNATEASISWGINGAPPGIIFNPSTLIISGTFNGNIDTLTGYHYTLTTVGGSVNASYVGSIWVIPVHEVVLHSSTGSDNQAICENSSLVPIVYELTGGATSATIYGLPSGVSSSIQDNIVTILGSPTVAPITETTYEYTLYTYGNECEQKTVTGTITIYPSIAETLAFVYTNSDLEAYGVIPERSFVEFNILTPANYETTKWDFGDSSPYEYGSTVFHEFVQSGQYEVTLTVYNSVGCSSSVAQTVLIGDGYNLLIPNVFTPNGDYINDKFRPVFNGVKALDFSVFDTLGKLLYTEKTTEESNSNEGISISGWDGSNAYKASDFYVYRVEATLINGDVIVKTGTFQLLR